MNKLDKNPTCFSFDILCYSYYSNSASNLKRWYDLKLSMWILADWLWKYNPIIYIKDGVQTLRGVRLYTQDMPLERQNVYLGRAQDFIGSGGDGVICVHEHDMMLLDTNDIDHVLMEVLAAFDFYNKWADDMIDSINNGCSLQKIIDDSHTIIDEPILVYDSSYKVLSYSSAYKHDLETTWKNLMGTNNNLFNKMVSFKPGLQKNEKVKSAYIANFPEMVNRSVWVNLFSFKMYLGQIIIIEHKHKITEGRLHLCAQLAHLIEYWIRYNDEQSEQKVEATLFANLLEDKHLLKEEVNQQLSLLNWKESDMKVIAKIFLFDSSPEIHQKIVNDVETHLHDCYTIFHEFSAAIIGNTSLISMEEIEKELKHILMENCCCCGVSFQFTNIMNLKLYYEQADIALKYGNPVAGSINYCSDYIMKYLLNVIKTNSKTAIIHPALYILKRYDESNKSELYNTLYQYLLHERNLVKTAEMLSIHRNSLLYRIKKIKELVDIDMDNPMLRQYLLISFQLLGRYYEQN